MAARTRRLIVHSWRTGMTGYIWIDLQMSLAGIEAELRDMSGELSRIPTVGNAIAPTWG
jgi:hypothetical protein